MPLKQPPSDAAFRLPQQIAWPRTLCRLSTHCGRRAFVICAVAHALNTRGVRTARGGSWHVSNVKNLIDRADRFCFL
jgi:hypothetical protein